MTLDEHVTLDILGPPRYEVPLDDSRNITQGSGLVGILRLDSETLNPQRFGPTLRIVRHLQRATPRLPWLLLMWRPRLPVEAARLIAALRCRGVLSPAGRSPDAVHAAVTWDGDLMAHLEHWIRTHTELGHGVWDWLAPLVEAGYHAAPGDPIPDAIEGAPRTIPATRRAWFHLGRGLRSALALHRHPGQSVARLALKLGFHDRSSLARHLKRAFGHTLA